MMEKILKFVQEYLADAERVSALQKRVFFSMGAAFIAYITSTVVVAISLPVMMDQIIGSKYVRQETNTDLNLRDKVNYREVNKGILARNIFNSEGQFPEENLESENKTKSDASRFNMDAPCTKTDQKIALVGTIFLGGGISLATVRESGIADADIYAVGDIIIGSDNVQVVAIERNRLVMNNAGRKECIEIAQDLIADSGMGGPGGNGKPGKVGESTEESVDLQATWVESELGDGFGKIIQSARLVPNTEDNRVNGFKIFAIKKDSLLDKVGFKDGDVIVQVNSTVMEAEQGFALYQALLDEKEITVRLLGQGKTPKTIKVHIK